MSEKQKTIQKEISLQGVGLHTGKKVTVCFKPAEVNSGICFVRTDLPDRPTLKADFSNMIEDAVPRSTSIGKGDVLVHTVEHIMSVLCGLNIDNLIIEIDGNELPGLDGSGIDFLKTLKKAGIIEQKEDRQYFDIREPILVQQNGATILALPASELKISYLLDYSDVGVCIQYCSVDIKPQTFEEELAPCRTFCLGSEEEELRKSGLGKGANYENTLVIAGDGVKDNKVRFKDEFARHKILDFIGDMYLLGAPIRAQIFAVKSGHSLNFALLRKIVEQWQKHKSKPSAGLPDFDKTKEINIKEIMKALPHRYPFLLVDRIVELEAGKRIVGIKNVTINDNFFQGHFPSRPIMPGVLMVEAMAQVAGVAMSVDQQHKNQLALFMGANNVKFRKIVTPGDQLVIEVEITKNKTRIARAHAEAKVDGKVVSEANITLSFTDSSFLD